MSMQHPKSGTVSRVPSRSDIAATSTSHSALGCQPIPADQYHLFQHVLRILFPPTVQLQKIQPLDGRVHPLRCLTLSNGVMLILKRSPRPTTALLRRERFLLETEARALALLGQRHNPSIPRLFYYDPQGDLLGSAFLLREYVRGSTIEEMNTLLAVDDREDIDRQLGILVNMIGQHVATSFGTLDRVAYGRGSRTWKEAFISLFEGLLRDAEDMFINLPYTEIRREVARLVRVLEQVKLPRLFIVDFGCPSQVLLDPQSKQVTGVLNFGNALWGDVLMAELFQSPSSAFLEGFGTPVGVSDAENVRLLLYACYRSVHRVTVQYYRNRDEATEMDARRQLTANLAEMVSTRLSPITPDAL